MSAPSTAAAVGSGRDPAFIDRTLGAARPIARRLHPGTVQGFEHLPEGGALLVGNHNGGMLTPDTWLLAVALWERFGAEGLPYALGHSVPLTWPAVGSILTKGGVVPAAHGNGETLLRDGRKVLVYPGGDEDAYRPWRKRKQVVFGGRCGYVRLALRAGVPIVPVAAAGAHEIFVVLDDLKPLARALGLAGPRFRTKVWPLTLSLPWGLTLGPVIPLLPLPVSIDLALLAPIHFERSGAEAAEDEAYVRACSDRVEAALQAGLDDLNRARDARPGWLKRPRRTPA